MGILMILMYVVAQVMELAKTTREVKANTPDRFCSATRCLGGLMR